jgi:RNA polymerase sigma-70 factor (ECF subfamily)
MEHFKKIQRGDIKEFERVFRDLYAPLCIFAQKYLHSAESAEEKVQDTFYKLWRDRQKISITDSLKAYLYKVVQNSCLQEIEHFKVEEKYAKFVKIQSMEFATDPFEEMKLKQMTQAIDQTLHLLPENCRKIFILSRYDGLKNREIAEKLSISIKTVEANISKALQAFKLNLKE